jgi:hypothetical protein
VKGDRNIKFGGCGEGMCGGAIYPELKYHLIKNIKTQNINRKPERQASQVFKTIVKDKIETRLQKQNGAGKVQYRGRRSSVMVPVPENVQKWAKYAFKLKKLGFKGGKETGWKRAKQLATKKEIPIEDLRYMRNWYARHYYTSYPGFREWYKAGKPKTSEWHNKHAIISWVIWSGSAGFKWVNSKKVLTLLNKHFDKKYTKIKNLY